MTLQLVDRSTIFCGKQCPYCKCADSWRVYDKNNYPVCNRCSNDFQVKFASDKVKTGARFIADDGSYLATRVTW